MDKVLNCWEIEKKYMHGKHCHDQGNFSLFVLSMYGMLGKEALVVTSDFSLLMVGKLEELILHASVWINRDISIVITRLYYCMLHGDCLPIPL